VGGRVAICILYECTSMELHTCAEGSIVLSLAEKMLDKRVGVSLGEVMILREFECVSEVVRADLENVNKTC
jgi:hypothetical protein